MFGRRKALFTQENKLTKLTMPTLLYGSVIKWANKIHINST